MEVSLIWITPDAEKLLGHIARVSNPANQSNDKVEGLINYMIKHQHWSPFEMVAACVEINTTRDIGRQILRHRSFTFQEFSQRYATSDLLSDELEYRECRLQDTVNRQNSVISDDDNINNGWAWMQREVYNTAMNCYHQALNNGIAKEQARALLPEGLTPTRMYMQGTLRSFIHYCQLRTGPETQKEHREIAQAVSMQLAKYVPTIWKATGLL